MGISEIRAADVQGFHERCTEAGVPGASTVKTIVNTLGQVLAHAQMLEVVEANAVDTWKAGRPRRRGAGLTLVPAEKVLTTLELNRLLYVARTEFGQDYPIVVLFSDTGCRIGEGLAVYWTDLDLVARKLWIRRSVDDAGRVGPTKTRRERQVDLSARLVAELTSLRPDVFGPETPVFPSRAGGLRTPSNFRSRVFKRLVRRALGPGRFAITPHSLRHTFASLHLAAGSNLKWVQAMGGWASAKMLLDVYGHYMPDETSGSADALTAPDGPYTAPALTVQPHRASTTGATRRAPTTKMEPTIRLERTTCSLRDEEDPE